MRGEWLLLAAQDRLKTLQELYLRATRTSQGPAAASALDMRLDAVDGIIHSAMPQGNAGGCMSDLDLSEPDSIVPALQQIAALRRERDMLRTQARLPPCIVSVHECDQSLHVIFIATRQMHRHDGA